MEELLQNDDFVQFIVNEFLPTKNMSSHEKIQQVFSSQEDFAKAMDSFRLKSSENLNPEH